MIPSSEERIIKGGTPHNEMIYRLAKLGLVAGYEVHIGRKEQSERWHGEDFSSIGLRKLPSLPMYDSPSARIVEQIDLLWLERSGKIVFAFEIEESTNFTSGIDRLTELLKIDPSLAGKITLVAPARRRRKLNDVLTNSHYIGAPMYMENKLVYAYYRDIVNLYRRLTGVSYDTKKLYEEILRLVQRPSLSR